MLRFMERSAIKLLKKRGKSNREIAKLLGRDRKTIARVVAEPTDKQSSVGKRSSVVDVYEPQIRQWISQGLPVAVMLSKVRSDSDQPYQDGRTAFYQRVKQIREQIEPSESSAIWRFEGLAGEYLQVDWGEVRNFPYVKTDGVTRYIFVARLKYSRFISIEFCDNMRYETLIRCLLGSFSAIGGVPWVVVFDNMKTVVLGRNSDGSPQWNERFLQFASEIEFHPQVCDVGAANQKGTVENGVKFVKGNFLPGRTFTDDKDLIQQAIDWQKQVNNQPNAAHGKTPQQLLPEEREAFFPLNETAKTYGILHSSKVNPESVIVYGRNYYSVPEHLIGQVVTVRVAAEAIKIYHANQLVATHQRCFDRHCWIRNLEHYQQTLEKKPRAKVMAYREKLLEIDPMVRQYIIVICRRDRNQMNDQILCLYQLWQQYSTAPFVAAIASAEKLGIYGADYIQSILANPDSQSVANRPVPLANTVERTSSQLIKAQPLQTAVDRDLSTYESYARH